MSKEIKETKVEKEIKETKVEDVLLSQPVSMRELQGMFETVTSAPTTKPKNVLNQIKFYSTGGVYRIYIYDAKNDVWRYSALT